VVAEHADLWNIPGGDIDDVISRSALLDRYCTEIGRDPAWVTRSIHLPVSYDQPSITQDAIGEAIDAGFRHIVLGLPAPYPANVAQWVTDELITTPAWYPGHRGNHPRGRGGVGRGPWGRGSV
jgi:alkanesulfonate monooxygenase SsuD/methylene tetrahydromethanopterin reductase-like flavin-dependent oxidoreductase (luciferase family)